MKKDKFYKVIVESDGCKTCMHGTLWTVVSAEDVGISQFFELRQDAEDICHYMNQAYEAGRKAKP